MSNRRAHTVYFSDDLRGRVDEMAENSNLSRADIYDEALEFFFAHYEISPEGNLTYNDDYRDMIGESTEGKREMLETILENQREMMESLEAPLPESENRGQNKNSQQTESTSDSDEIKVRDEFDYLRAEYDHDECIDPGEVNPDRIKKTRDIRVPVLAGILNWMVEEKRKKRMEKSELVDIAETELEVSRQSARNYVDELDRRGMIYPHPSIDSDLLDERENIIMDAASATMNHDMGGVRISDLDSTRQKRYDKELSEYVGDYMEWDMDEYYLTSDAYVSDVWIVIKSAAQEIASTTNETNRKRDKTRLNQKERVFATSRLLVLLYRKWRDVSGVDYDNIVGTIGQTKRVTDEDELEEWIETWVQDIERVDDELVGCGESDEMSEEKAREILGVDEGVSDEKVKNIWQDTVLQNHPDVSSDSEVDDFEELKTAKNVLLNNTY